MPGIRVLRHRDGYRVVRAALIAGADRFGMRVVHFSVQSNHIHLICEATDRRSLSRGMQGLLIRIAKGVNRLLDRKGRVFGDRYHEHILRTPTEVRAALAYLLHNARNHLARRGYRRARWFLDPCSSARQFFGLVDRDADGEMLADVPLPPARSWLLRTGWRRAGPVEIG